mgnify:FL=1
MLKVIANHNEQSVRGDKLCLPGWKVQSLEGECPVPAGSDFDFDHPLSVTFFGY